MTPEPEKTYKVWLENEPETQGELKTSLGPAYAAYIFGKDLFEKSNDPLEVAATFLVQNLETKETWEVWGSVEFVASFKVNEAVKVDA